MRVYLCQVERNQLTKYRWATLFDLPKRMLAVLVFFWVYPLLINVVSNCFHTENLYGAGFVCA